MKVLVTGAFGNIGTSVLRELLNQGHQVRCFDIKNKANEKTARRYGDKIEVVWGDLRKPVQIAGAVHDCDAVIHLAFIIPKLSATGVGSEDRPDFARQINVGGTANLIKAMQDLARPPRMVFASSQAVFGRTQDQPGCRKATDPVQAIDHYTRHKIECEELVKASGLEWTILRLAAAFPQNLRLDPGMFDVPLDNRIEFAHTLDVGLALANAAGAPGVWGKTLLIGGGRRNQFYYRDLVKIILDDMGIGPLPEEAFSIVPFCTDWLDTEESQALLHYQNHDLKDYTRTLRGLLGFKRGLIRIFRPLARAYLLNKSPYYRFAHPHTYWLGPLFNRRAPAGANAK